MGCRGCVCGGKDKGLHWLEEANKAADPLEASDEAD